MNIAEPSIETLRASDRDRRSADLDDIAMAPSGPPEVSNHFPPSVRDRLVRAAADPNPTRRAMEIDRAIEWGRARYPQGFVW